MPRDLASFVILIVIVKRHLISLEGASWRIAYTEASDATRPFFSPQKRGKAPLIVFTLASRTRFPDYQAKTSQPGMTSEILLPSRPVAAFLLTVSLVFLAAPTLCFASFQHGLGDFVASLRITGRITLNSITHPVSARPTMWQVGAQVRMVFIWPRMAYQCACNSAIYCRGIEVSIYALDEVAVTVLSGAECNLAPMPEEFTPITCVMSCRASSGRNDNMHQIKHLNPSCNQTTPQPPRP